MLSAVHGRMSSQTTSSPWWPRAAVRRAGRHLTATPSADVLELGGGNSSRWLAERASSLTVLETSEKWAGHIDQSLRAFSSAHVVLAPDLRSALERQVHPPTGWHLVVVDFREDPADMSRVEAAQLCWPHVRQGGCVLLDDSDRYEWNPPEAHIVRVRGFRSRPLALSETAFYVKT